MILVLSGSAATGKTSLAMALAEQRPDIERVITHTTRATRPGEVDGEHYHFVSRVFFRSHIFPEKSYIPPFNVNGSWYGIFQYNYQRMEYARPHQVIVLAEDGALQVREDFPDVICAYILSNQTESRLAERGEIQGVSQDITIPSWYDPILVNDDFDGTVAKLSELLPNKET